MQYDDTRIYRTSLELVSLCSEVIDDLPRGLGFWQISCAAPVRGWRAAGARFARRPARSLGAAQGVQLDEIPRLFGAAIEIQAELGFESC